jgi:hypothetical protein
VVGQEKNIDVVFYLYTVIKRELLRLLAEDWAAHKASYIAMGTGKNKHGSSFLYGALDAITAKLAAQKREAEAEPAMMQLIVVNDAELKTAIGELYSTTKQTKVRGTKLDGHAYSVGYEAGKRTNPTPAIK